MQLFLASGESFFFLAFFLRLRDGSRSVCVTRDTKTISKRKKKTRKKRFYPINEKIERWGFHVLCPPQEACPCGLCVVFTARCYLLCVCSCIVCAKNFVCVFRFRFSSTVLLRRASNSDSIWRRWRQRKSGKIVWKTTILLTSRRSKCFLRARMAPKYDRNSQKSALQWFFMENWGVSWLLRNSRRCPCLLSVVRVRNTRVIRVPSSTVCLSLFCHSLFQFDILDFCWSCIIDRTGQEHKRETYTFLYGLFFFLCPSLFQFDILDFCWSFVIDHTGQEHNGDTCPFFWGLSLFFVSFLISIFHF